MARSIPSRIAATVVGLLLLTPPMALAAPAASGPSAPAGAPAVRAPVGQATPAVFVGGGPVAHRTSPIAIPFLSMDPGALRAAKLRAAAAASVGGRAPQAATSLPALASVGVNKGGLVDHMVTPPDSTGAIGPTRYVEMVNQQVGVYDRNLAAVSSTDLTSFVAASGWTVSDPQVEWDPQGRRWLYAAVGIASGNNVLLFGWSKTEDPSNLSSGWCRFGVYRHEFLDDYPKLGHDDNYLTIGSNVYTDKVAGYGWVTATVWAIPKPAPGDASCAAPASAYNFADGANPLLNADGSPASTPVPANNAGAAAVGYVVAGHSPLDAPAGPRSDLMVWHVMPAGGGPAPALVADGEVGVGSFDIPAPAPQAGTTLKLDTLDARLTQAVAAYDPSAGEVGLWTQHTIAGTGGRSVVRWYELLPGSLAVRQQGQVESATDFVFNGAISPTAGGSAAAIFYNRGGTAQATVIGAQTRSAATPLGNMDAGELLLGTSTTYDRDFSCSATTPCRWGDYAGATPDPVNAGTVWGSSQVTGACYVLCGWFAQWTTRNFAVVASEVAPPSPPGAPTLDPAIAGDGQVSLAWSAPANDGGAPITNYQVLRGGSSGSEVLVATLGNVLTYTDTGLVNGTPYFYTVAAVNSAGAGTASNEVSATPQSPPPPPPTAPGAPTLDPATAGDGQVSLSWSAPADDGGAAVTDYVVYRSQLSGEETAFAASGGALTYTDTSVANGTTYFYTVAAVNSAGTGAQSNEVSATPQSPPPPPPSPPDAPTLTAATGGNSQVSLSWSAPANDGGAPITNYQVLRGGSSGSEVVVATLGTVLTYTDTGLTNGQSYYYEVAAVNSAGAGAASNELSAVPKAPPSAPRNLIAKAKVGQIKLTWLAPLSNGGAAITGYEIWRATSSGGEVRIATVGSVLSFIDTSVARHTTYFYFVRAVNGFDLTGPASNEVSILSR